MEERYTISMRNTNISFPCDGETPVLRAMFHAVSGPLFYGCGGCGICKARIISGDYTAFRPQSATHISEADKRKALPCCAV